MTDRRAAVDPTDPPDRTPPRFTTAVGWAGAACIAVPIALNAVSHLIDPLTGDNAMALVAEAAAHPAATTATGLLKLPLAFGVAGALALAWLGRRSARLALIGGALLFLSWLATPWDLSPYVTAPLAVGRGPAVTAFLDTINGSAFVEVAALVAHVGNLLGYVLLGIALTRSHVAPRWVGSGLAVAAVANVVSHVVDGPTAVSGVVQTVVWVVFAVAAAGAARAFLRERRSLAATSR